MKKSNNIGDLIESTSQEFDPVVHEISVMRQIILERVHPFDLLRELVSNAAAKEVGATEISIKYALLKTSVTAMFWLTPEGVSQHLEGGFGQQLARFA